MSAAYTSPSAIKTHMGVTDSNDDAAFTAIATAVNDYIEDWIGFPGTVAGSDATAVRTYDGDGTDELFIRGGVTDIQTFEVADQTGGTFTTYTDYVLKPYSHERPTGWPASYLKLTDLSTTLLTTGYQTVRITPGTAGVWGFAAMPTMLSRIADVLGVRLFQSRKTGETFVIGTTDFGQAIARFVAEYDYQRYLDHLAGSLGGRSKVG